MTEDGGRPCAPGLVRPPSFRTLTISIRPLRSVCVHPGEAWSCACRAPEAPSASGHENFSAAAAFASRLPHRSPRRSWRPCRCSLLLLRVRQLTWRGMGARRVGSGGPGRRRCVAVRAARLRGSRPPTNSDHVARTKPTPRRADRVLPVVGVVRGPGSRGEVRPAGELRARACGSWARPTGDARSGRRGLGESERSHARACAGLT